MTFSAFENSIASGQPIWLYDFARDYLHWRYTSADRDILWFDYTWTARAISHDRISESTEPGRKTLTITAPADLDFAQQYRVIGPSDPILLTVRKLHDGDTDAPVQWLGKVHGVAWPRQHCLITAVPAADAMAQPGLRRVVSRNCPYPLYSVGLGRCNLDRTTKRVDMLITALTSTSITTAEFATLATSQGNGYFTGGYIAWEVQPNILQRRFISLHNAGIADLLSGTYGLAVGTSIRAYPGCAHTDTACDTLGNLLNFGGLKYLPDRSPFDGNPVY